MHTVLPAYIHPDLLDKQIWQSRFQQMCQFISILWLFHAIYQSKCLTVRHILEHLAAGSGLQQDPVCSRIPRAVVGTMAVSVVVLIVTSLSAILVLNGILPWLRTAWMLRKLPKGPKNMLYGGLVSMLSHNRLRALEQMNKNVVSGSGVWHLNVLWRQVYKFSAISNDYVEGMT